MICKHAKAEFSAVNPVLLIELSVRKPHLEGSWILRGRTARRCTYLLVSPSLFHEGVIQTLPSPPTPPLIRQLPSCPTHKRRV